MVGAIYANIGLGADRAGQTAPAVLAYGQALAFDESRTDLLFNLGSALYASGATAGAIRTYEAVLAREPDHGPARAVAEHGAAYGIQIGAVADLRARAATEGADGSARALLAEYWSE